MLFATKTFVPKQKSFPLNHGGGRKSKDIKTMGAGGFVCFYFVVWGVLFVYLAGGFYL